MSVRRGSSNGNVSGSSYDRRARKRWLLLEYGDGELTTCYRCDVPLLFDDLTVDRIIPGIFGGKYVHSNIRPACEFCNTETGAPLSSQRGKELYRNGKHV